MALDLLFIILGLIFGSFISALSFRYPKNISVLKGRSFCPNCKKIIRWYDNIPLFSFVLLGGKCRSCKKSISWRYPAIEFLTSLGFLLIYLRFSPDLLSLVYYLLIYCLLVLIFVVDLEHQIIPDRFVFFGILVVFLHYFLFRNSYLYPIVFAGIASSSTLLMIHLATRGRGMGLGDVKFAILGGMIAGVNLFLVWLFTSFLTGGIVGIILILVGRAKLKSKIAFGPFLVVGLILALIWGERILLLLH